MSVSLNEALIGCCGNLLFSKSFGPWSWASRHLLRAKEGESWCLIGGSGGEHRFQAQMLHIHPFSMLIFLPPLFFTGCSFSFINVLFLIEGKSMQVVQSCCEPWKNLKRPFFKCQFDWLWCDRTAESKHLQMASWGNFKPVLLKADSVEVLSC